MVWYLCIASYIHDSSCGKPSYGTCGYVSFTPKKVWRYMEIHKAVMLCSTHSMLWCTHEQYKPYKQLKEKCVDDADTVMLGANLDARGWRFPWVDMYSESSKRAQKLDAIVVQRRFGADLHAGGRRSLSTLNSQGERQDAGLLLTREQHKPCSIKSMASSSFFAWSPPSCEVVFPRLLKPRNGIRISSEHLN